MTPENGQREPENYSPRGYIRRRTALAMVILATGAGAAGRNQIDPPAFSQGVAPIEATATPTPTATPEESTGAASAEDPFAEFEGTGMTPEEICRGAALGGISSIDIDVKKDSKHKGKQELVWRYNNNFIPKACAEVGRWAVKLSLKPSIVKKVKPYIIKNGKKVKTGSISIQNPTQEHGSYTSTMYLGKKFPSEGRASELDRDYTSWTPNGGKTERRRQGPMAVVTYRGKN